MSKFQNKYRIPSTRLQNWDYGWNGAYFVTICTAKRKHYFGKVGNGEMQLSNIGTIADVLWCEIKRRAQNIELDAFVIMPNHIHGIIILAGNETSVETKHASSLQSESDSQFKTIGQKRFQNQGKNTLSSIVGSYKSAVSKHAHRLNYDFAWQPRFHDHIIRDDNSYEKIRNYIINNPKNWDNDKFYIL